MHGSPFIIQEITVLVIKVELHSAVTRKVTLLGSMIIDNVGGTKESGNYRVRVGHKKNCDDLKAVAVNPLREGSVKNFPRLSYNVWRLVYRALKSTFPEEK